MECLGMALLRQLCMMPFHFIFRLGPKIPMREITSTQLISYDLEKNLIPLVLSHCNYSLEVGKGCDISYDFAGIERQLVDRFLTGKPQIQFEVMIDSSYNCV